MGPDGEATALAPGVAWGSARDVALSGDGTTAIVTTDADGVVTGQTGPGTYRVDVATGTVTRLTTDSGGPLAVSEDGTVVVTTEPRPGGGRRVVRFVGTSATVLDDAPVSLPPNAWDPIALTDDGATVVYGVTPTSGPVAYALRLWSAASGTTTTVQTDVVARHVAVSADGAVVMFVGEDSEATGGRRGDLYRWEQSTGDVEWAVATNGVSTGAVSVALTTDGETRSSSATRSGTPRRPATPAGASTPGRPERSGRPSLRGWGQAGVRSSKTMMLPP